ncbi:Metallo-beta-lactamase family protein [Candidatus Rhodobacter oscarellae]|uniref:Metallo-beta-lactamase family protein n=1 Tax=Candidatus Rhodobacter oscarellae TaxID=1675527 RepID=A0A0J9E4H2_9RHOB|nr:MBL fold metallo-hydrolase [Candidatus Rhodobacter lobularis]KMW57690.1 Metallo-beta-lactamase family protein [Candidatus Rhodobacter lobularis]
MDAAYDPTPGLVAHLEPGLRRVLAPNPSPMTFHGTNTYILGEGEVAVIDPGPKDAKHLAAIQAALEPGERVSHILVTHSHLDHSPLASELSAATGAPIYAFGDSLAGRSEVMTRLAARGLAGGGEGVDHAFRPHETLVDGAEITVSGLTLQAIWTPGHLGNHMCFATQDVVFSGDHVMGWASTMISPPDGDLTDFMRSARLLEARTDRVFYPGHGAPIPDPQARVRWLIDHRLAREAAILEALSRAPARVPAMTREIYTDAPPALLSAAERNVFAHVIDLCQRDLVSARPTLSADAEFVRN